MPPPPTPRRVKKRFGAPTRLMLCDEDEKAMSTGNEIRAVDCY